MPKFFWSRRSAILTAAMLFLGTQNAGAQDQTVRVKDDRGTEVVLAQPATRIAAVSTVASDFLIAIGKKPVAFARTGDKVIPTFLGPSIEGLPDLGSRAVPNLEKLAETRPDLIVAIRRYTERAAIQYEKIAPYLAFDVATYEDSFNAVTVLGAATGHAKEAAEMNAQFTTLVDELGRKAPGNPSAAILWGDGTAPWIYFNGYMTAKLLGKLKIRNVFGDSPDPAEKNKFANQINLEELMLKDPDLIFVFLPPDVQMEANPIWQKLRAVKNGKAFAVGVQWMEVHGPLAREMVLREMAHLAYPAVFAAPKLAEGLAAKAFAKP